MTLAILVLGSQVALAKTLRCANTYDIPVPSSKDEMPNIETDYETVTTLFSLNFQNLVLVAMDKDEPGRLRLAISAQYNRLNGKYEGQYIVDEGGNQVQLRNGPEVCTAL